MGKILFESIEELHEWLQANHASQESVWLIKWKKESGNPFISYDEIVDELICFGWVDSLPRKLNEEKTMLRISPRNPKSNWSGVNKERVARLIKVGKMEPSGMKMVEIAKQNGTWNFLDDVERLEIPPDLREALAMTGKAKYYFDRFPPSSKRGILEWIKSAKQTSTRINRIHETALKASKNVKANHPKGRDSSPEDK